MKYFFQDISDLSHSIRVTEAYNFAEIEPFLERAFNKYLNNNIGIGQELASVILAEYNKGYDILTDKKKELVNLVRPVVGNLAFYHYIPVGSLIFGADGVTTIEKENRKKALKWERDQARDEFLDAGFEALESLLFHLEKNKDDFSQWKNSEAFTIFKECFITSVADFSREYPLLQSRRTFLAIKHIMRRIQQHAIADVMGQSAYDELFNKHNGTNTTPLTVTQKKCLLNIKPALAYLTMAEAYTELGIVITNKGVQIFSKDSTTLDNEAAAPVEKERLSKLEFAARDKGKFFLNEIRKIMSPDAAEVKPERRNDQNNKTYYV